MYSSDKEQKDSIINFAPVDNLMFKSDKPVYYSIEGDLRYSAIGTFDLSSKVIYNNSSKTLKNDIRGAFVSPDGQLILIYEELQLILLDNTGRQIDVIRNVTYSNPTIGNFDALSVQWTKCCQFFYILNFDKPHSSEQKFNTILFRYSIAKKSVEPLFHFNDEVYPFHFHLTQDNSSIIFKSLYSVGFPFFGLVESMEIYQN